MIVAYLAYVYFKKSVEIPVFPTSFRVPKIALCVWGLKKFPKFPSDAEGNECHLGDD